MEIVPEPYDVPSLINDVVTLINVRIGDKPIEFIVEDSPTIPRTLVGDCVRLKQVLINMLTNAVKFTHAGHIKLVLEAVPVSGSTILLRGRVEDTGIGIKREDLPLLFGNFSQLDTKKNRNVEGTGLGLAITKNLLELMGGSISVESVYGRGTCFFFDVTQGFTESVPVVALDNAHKHKVGVWLAHESKAESLLAKMRSLEVPTDILTGPERLAEYTHVFFDYEKLASMDAAAVPDTKLIAISRDYHGGQGLPGNVVVMCAPLTTLAATRFLGEGGAADAWDIDDGLRNGIELVNVKCLVVDDNDINLIIAGSVLEELGAEVETALSGKAAIRKLEETAYDMVFMDHMMPDMDGVETAIFIRKMSAERCRSVPIVALTANAVGDVRAMFLENGMNDFLSKPLVMKELERVLREWLPKEKWKIKE